MLGDLNVNLNAAMAPDGTLHATRAVSSGGGHALVQTVAVIPGATYIFSFFARNNGGSAASYSIYGNTHSAEVVPPTSYMSRLNGTRYTRVSVAFTAPAGCTSLAVYPLRDSRAPVNVHLWGAKLEIGNTLSPYGSNLGPAIASVTAAPASVFGGTTAQGTVTLPIEAGPDGALAQLASSDPARPSVREGGVGDVVVGPGVEQLGRRLALATGGLCESRPKTPWHLTA